MRTSIAHHGVVGINIEASDKGAHWIDIIITDANGAETETTIFTQHSNVDRDGLKIKLLEQIKDAATTALQELDNG
jgi:hypothetical protein